MTHCPICTTRLADGAMFCGTCGSVPTAQRRPRAADTAVIRRGGTGVVSVGVLASEQPETRPGEQPRFRLEFSTGQVATVFGRGLIGRSPTAAPGERFDHLVQIDDPDLSVSKTHLEFSERDGLFCVVDRFSTNGVSVSVPGEPVQRCEPAVQYALPRGSRFTIGRVSVQLS